MGSPLIAYLDIETAPISGLSWTIYDTNLIHVIEPTFILSYAIKWEGQTRVKTHALCDYPLYAKNKLSDRELAKTLWADIDKADIIIAHNGDQFDLKKINSRLVVHGFPPPSPYKTIDTLKVARRHFRFDSNKLDNIGRYLGVGRKLAHTGKDLWLGCMNGDPASWKVMRRYNAHDVVLLEAVYQKLKAWDSSHPNLALYDDTPGCPKCRSTRIQHRGFNVAKTRKTARMHCQDCGGWFSGPRKGAA